eukprot:TRINITY_DN13210_c0_g1_i1.p1 TRINITY_DN13210_c0_g1~~TRINITY_DN13210_c0_g1_i1.p1  ORF type:complete len:309 (-),score=23.71 TRINITY_DN13210_c0_g1_i1:231-1157(-)
MRSTVTLLCLLVCLFVGTQSFFDQIPPSDSDFHTIDDSIDAYLEAVDPEEMFQVPLYEHEDSDIIELLLNNEELPAFRESNTRAIYGMSVPEYEAKFDEARDSILSLASKLGVETDIAADSYSGLMTKVEGAIEQQGRVEELSSHLQSLHRLRYLFKNRYSLHSARLQDAQLAGVNSLIERAINWSISKLRSHKCTWCRKIAGYIRSKACTKAGSVMCTALAAAAAETGLSGVIKKYVCGKPIKLSNVFAGWCQKGVKLVQKWRHASDSCLCSFSVPTFHIGPINALAIHVKRHTVSLGHVCPATHCF